MKKNPSFLKVVILAAIFILIALGSVIFLIKEREKKMPPHHPDPQPNSRLSRPAALSGSLSRSS